MNIDEVKIYVLVFFIYAFAGWIMETTSISIRNKKFVNRGFLIGPVCPIYGYGVVLVSLLLQKYQNDIIVTFFMSIIICGFLEYFTSYFMEIIFKARWWDYSQRKFNIIWISKLCNNICNKSIYNKTFKNDTKYGTKCIDWSIISSPFS